MISEDVREILNQILKEQFKLVDEQMNEDIQIIDEKLGERLKNNDRSFLEMIKTVLIYEKSTFGLLGLLYKQVDGLEGVVKSMGNLLNLITGSLKIQQKDRDALTYLLNAFNREMKEVREFKEILNGILEKRKKTLENNR